MSEQDKERQWKRYRRGEKHRKTRTEEQQLKEARRARAQPSKARDAMGEDETFVKMRRRERVLGPQRRRVDVPSTASAQATIVGLARGRARVLGVDGERSAVLAPHLAQAQQTEIAVGDEVLLHERAGAEPLVAQVLPRRSELARPDPHNPHRRRVLAANVDWVVLVLSAERLRVGLIDRMAQALAGSGARLAVCVNKCDVPPDAAECAAALQLCAVTKLPVILTSALRGDGLDELRALVLGRTCAFVGHSGVGKSSLLNRLDAGRVRATAAVRDGDGKGRHTTSASSLVALDDGTRLIDTPGVRAFGLDDGGGEEAVAFPEITTLAAACRFRDCAHVHEPGCAVRAAVEQGTLAEARYAGFLRLFHPPS